MMQHWRGRRGRDGEGKMHTPETLFNPKAIATQKKMTKSHVQLTLIIT